MLSQCPNNGRWEERAKDARFSAYFSFIHKYWCRDEFWRGQDVLAILTQNGAHTNFDQDQALKFFQWGCNPNNLCLVNVQTAGGVKREQYLFVTWCVYPNPDLGRSRCPINGREKQEQKFAKNCFIITSNQIPIRFCQASSPRSPIPKTKTGEQTLFSIIERLGNISTNMRFWFSSSIKAGFI